MAAFVPPEAFAPAAVEIREERLWAPPSETPLSFPVPGAWRSFAQTGATSTTQIRKVAQRFGGLTPMAATDVGEFRGELLIEWEWLIVALRDLSDAWTETGALADRVAIARARRRGDTLLDHILDQHHREGGWFEVVDGQWAMQCLHMEHWWLLTAITDVERLDPMRRCRHCGLWFSLTGLRADAGFCSPAHRSAFYQKRPPASSFWAEVI
jgi:hypothetical protein